jgi:hypothetical protein
VKVDVELFGQLLPGVERRQTLKMDHPMSVQEIALLLGLVPEEIGLISINGIQSEMDDLISLDSRLCFFPPLSGG